jgi:hypothetical protein
VTLQLDGPLKKTLETLFVVSAQVPSLALSNPSLNEDAAAVFRVAKEFALNVPQTELCRVEIEDVVRLLRFACWMIASPGENSRELKQLLAHVVMQMQSRQSNFESLLKSYGVDRQLENQLPKQATTARPMTVSAQHTNRVNQTRIRISKEGAEMQTTTSESTWVASRRK